MMRIRLQVLLLLSLLLAACCFQGALYCSHLSGSCKGGKWSAASGTACKLSMQQQQQQQQKPQRKVVVSGGGNKKRIIPQGKPREQELANPNKLRVISGRAKGMKIESPDVYLRPMMAKVRAAVFSTLTHLQVFDTNTTRVLDVFAGSGSVGIEALSRGACHTTFVDLSPVCIASSMKNAAHCGFGGMTSSACGTAEDVLEFPTKYNLHQPYQIISLTPPYEEVDYSVLIDKLSKSPLIEENTIVLLEYPVEMGTLPFVLGDHQMIGLRNRRYGRTILAMYVNKPTFQFEFRQEEFTLESISRR